VPSLRAITRNPSCLISCSQSRAGRRLGGLGGQAGCDEPGRVPAGLFGTPEHGAPIARLATEFESFLNSKRGALPACSAIAVNPYPSHAATVRKMSPVIRHNSGCSGGAGRRRSLLS